MATYGISMVRDEADVVEGTIRHMAAEVDHLIVADNRSADGTRSILDQLASELPLTVVDDPDPAHYQGRKMSALAERAGDAGADWVVPFDADELWYSPLGRIADVLALAVGNLASGSLFNHWSTAVDPAGVDPFRTMGWRDQNPSRLPKVAFRWRRGATLHEGNHGVDLPGHPHPAVVVLEIRHFPYRTPEQFARKAQQGAAALAATTLPTGVGAHWRLYAEAAERHGIEALHDHFRRHFWHFAPLDSGLVHDPAPYRRWETP